MTDRGEVQNVAGGRPSPAGPAAEASDATARASVADGLDHRLDPRHVTASRLVGGLTVMILAGLSGGGLALAAAGRVGGLGLAGALVGWLVLWVVLGALAVVWPALSWRYTSYRIDERGIRIRRGVLFRSEVSVPRSRVQHTDVSRGPVERGFGLATLVIHTAGTQHASVSLSGLTAERAYPIRDYLIDSGEGDAV